MHHLFKHIVIFALAAGVVQGTTAQPITKKDMKRLERYMTGEFSSEAQSKADTNYFHIKLRMVRCSLSNNAGFWLYVEQAVAGAENKPYRQRVYHVFKENRYTIVSKVYELKNPAQYIGAWNNKVKLGVLKTDSLIDRQGCSIYLHKKEKKVFAGSTPGKECLSSLRGATYATSEVEIFSDRMASWDRGWNKGDKQVWGAEKGGYVFIKQQ
jgi:hypothetical protein